MGKNKINETVDCICSWIQDNIAHEKTVGNAHEIAEMTRASSKAGIC